MTMAHARLNDKEIAERADAIYSGNLRARLEADADNIGKIIVIDVASGDYEIDSAILAAGDRLRARRPDGDFYAMRIGYDTVYGIGVAPRRTKP
jgi:hypothetical protein